MTERLRPSVRMGEIAVLTTALMSTSEVQALPDWLNPSSVASAVAPLSADLSPLTSSPVTSSPLTSSPLTSSPLTSFPSSIPPTLIQPRANSLGGLTPGPLTPGPLTPGPLTPGPLAASGLPLDLSQFPPMDQGRSPLRFQARWIPASWWYGGSTSPLAIAIGAAEGTREPDGRYTAAYYWHADPGNGANNFGSFSYQHLSPEEQARVERQESGGEKRWVAAMQALPELADLRQLEKLRQFHERLLAQAEAQGLRLSPLELLNGLDLANQSEAAALDTWGYIDRLAQLKRVQPNQNPIEQIKEARTWSYWHPHQGGWDAPGLGNHYAAVRHDQGRRVDALYHSLQVIERQARAWDGVVALQRGATESVAESETRIDERLKVRVERYSETVALDGVHAEAIAAQLIEGWTHTLGSEPMYTGTGYAGVEDLGVEDLRVEDLRAENVGSEIATGAIAPPDSPGTHSSATHAPSHPSSSNPSPSNPKQAWDSQPWDSQQWSWTALAPMEPMVISPGVWLGAEHPSLTAQPLAPTTEPLDALLAPESASSPQPSRLQSPTSQPSTSQPSTSQPSSPQPPPSTSLAPNPPLMDEAQITPSKETHNKTQGEISYENLGPEQSHPSPPQDEERAQPPAQPIAPQLPAPPGPTPAWSWSDSPDQSEPSRALQSAIPGSHFSDLLGHHSSVGIPSLASLEVDSEAIAGEIIFFDRP